MKKGKTLLATLFLFSSVLASSVGTIVSAEEISQNIPAESETTTEAEAQTESEAPTEAEAPTESEAPTEAEVPTELEAPTEAEVPTESEAPTETEAPTESEEPTPEEPTPEGPIEMDTVQVRAQLQALIDEAKTFLDYTKYDNDILYYLENYIVNAEAALADATSTAEVLQNHIIVLTTALNYVKDPANAREENTDISINVTDKTMYVGDVITTELLLGWATIENADDLSLEVEVIGQPIMINSITNQLVQAGTYTIRYTIKSVDPDGNPLVARNSGLQPQMVVLSKDITLTVIDKSSTPEKDTNSDDSPAPVESLNSNQPQSVTNPIVSDTKVNQSINTDKKLPQTGEENAPMLIALGGVILAAGAYLLNKRQIENK
ncbi:LPXTG cell wall anchor domain-containing protein [Erwinia sp. CPCC 100877]|nr:LPXTG cell wall anchor domain-containing protein [Erwinia sp. CPCC 100877]